MGNGETVPSDRKERRKGGRRRKALGPAPNVITTRATDDALAWIDDLCNASGRCGSDLVWEGLKRLAESDFPSVRQQPPRLN